MLPNFESRDVGSRDYRPQLRALIDVFTGHKDVSVAGTCKLLKEPLSRSRQTPVRLILCKFNYCLSPVVQTKLRTRGLMNFLSSDCIPETHHFIEPPCANSFKTWFGGLGGGYRPALRVPKEPIGTHEVYCFASCSRCGSGRHWWGALTTDIAVAVSVREQDEVGYVTEGSFRLRREANPLKYLLSDTHHLIWSCRNFFPTKKT